MKFGGRLRGVRLAGALLTGAAIVAVAGCATPPPVVRTQVTAFNQWAALPAEKTYVFGRTLELQNSLELKSYEDIVRDELILQGFAEVADPAQARMTVTLRPAIATREVRVSDPWQGYPFWRPYGWYGGRPFGWYDPYWGFPPANDYLVTVYRKKLELDIDARGATGKRLYEGTVQSDGGSDSLGAVMPYLIRSLFTDFPGNNGVTKRIDVPIADK